MKSITYSAIRTFLNCRKLFEFRYIRKLKPIDEPIYFGIGSAFHKAIELWYDKHDADLSRGAIRSYFEAKAPDMEAENYFEREQEIKAALDDTMRIFSRYLNHYREEDKGLEFMEIEKDLSINASKMGLWAGIEIRLRVDAIVKKSGLLYLMEHKTAKGINALYKKKLTVDLQSMFYILCLRSLGFPVQGVIYNVTSSTLPMKPEVLKSGKISTAKNRKPDLREYIAEIERNGLDVNDYSEYLDWLKDNQGEYFYREIIIYHEKQFEYLLNDLNSVIFDIAKAWTEGENPESHYLYRNTSNCIGFGTCPFFDICQSIYPETVIENMFLDKESLHEEFDDTPGA